MLRQDRQIVEQPKPWGEGDREGDHHGMRVDCRHSQLLPARLERVGERAPRLFVVYRVKRKQHVG